MAYGAFQANGGTVEDQEKLKSEVYWLWRIHPNKRYEEALFLDFPGVSWCFYGLERRGKRSKKS